MENVKSYDELLALYLHPTCKGFSTHPHCVASRKSATCRDYLQMGIWVTNGIITEARFQGQGCVISKAVASLTVEMLIGYSLEQVCIIQPQDIFALLGFDLTPAKQECALLSWHLLRLLVASERLNYL